MTVFNNWLTKILEILINDPSASKGYYKTTIPPNFLFIFCCENIAYYKTLDLGF